MNVFKWKNYALWGRENYDDARMHILMQHIHRKHDYIEMLHKLMDYVVISEDVFISFYFVFNANV